VIDLTTAQARLLRPGGLTVEAVAEIIGPLGRVASGDGVVRSPGMLASHYAPSLPLRLEAKEVLPGEALLAFGATRPAGAERATSVLNLSARGDLIEAAANLFSHLRALDAAGAGAIAVMPIPNEGLGEAINDRLARAGAQR
jgi:L-threonylcarbamoyladenylate synthase